MHDTAVFTIISKNYYHFARTLFESLSRHHPEWDRYLILADEPDDKIPAEIADYCLVPLRELSLPNIRQFLFRYTILELNTAVKPWAFEFILGKGHRRVVYLDPDIYLYGRLEKVEAAWDAGNLLVLTPHLTDFADDDRKPGELEIIRAGTYNLGFLGLAADPETMRFLHWWQGKLEYNCVSDPDKGIFVDQKWIDLAPGLFDGVKVLRHPGYNVAYWNLKQRVMAERDGGYFVNGEGLAFFHFSGLSPDAIDGVSKHQNRFTYHGLNEAAKHIVREYAARVIQNGYDESRHWPYSYGRFTNGVLIADMLRSLYRTSPILQERAGGDPFQACEALTAVQCRAEDERKSLPLITPLMFELWNQSSHLRTVFPGIWGADRRAYCRWFLDCAQVDFGFPREYLEPISRSLKGAEKTRVPIPRKPKAWLRYHAIVLAKMIYHKLRPFISKRIPLVVKVRVWGYLQRHLLAIRTKPVPSRSVQNLDRRLLPGVNLIGYARAEMGIGEACRSLARALTAARVDFGLINYTYGNPARMNDLTWAHKETDAAAYRTNLIVVNADQLPHLYRVLGPGVLGKRYNIGQWAWELPEFPDEWCYCFDYLDEIWVCSNFVANSIAPKSPIPVLRMPLAIELACEELLGRDHFGLPADKYLFLAMYDSNSVLMRKNPQAAIEAFKRFFTRRAEPAGLVIKVHNAQGRPEEVACLREIIAGYDNIYLITETLARGELNSLLACVDCFVSLHRSEGFGLVLAEAMFLGKPVIATDWSGNTDFMKPDNSCPVRYELVRLTQDYPPYKAGQIWAEPDVEHAGQYMRRLFEDQAWAREIARAGQHTIKTEYSPAAVGEMIRRRLAARDLL